MTRSPEVRQKRMARVPPIVYPEELPIAAQREEIARAIAAHQVVIVAGETGSGKTTQLPKICLELGRGLDGVIGCTQPRRIAARSVAARIARELGTPLGDVVGYKVRFQESGSGENLIRVMTDGILLAETQSDPLLARYDTLIIDEAHERSLNIDFLLGYLKRLLSPRPDLKIIITSATINTERFSRHFGDAPVIEVSGRLYPVEIRYRPVRSEDEDAKERDLEQAIVDAVDEVARLSRDGDILVFLPGEREIRDTAELLRKHHPPGVEILPLYARQSREEQDRVFAPHGARRIVLATNVAETSLTVPGIRYVIDPGLARVKRYSYRNKVDQLLIEPISQASANQRAGRCGRVASGVCVRLYSEAEFQARPLFNDPEILRTSLAGTILRMEALGLGAVEDFPFLDPPTGRMIADGYGLLHELGAVDEQRRLTRIGAELAKLPVDPRIGRMLLAARQEHCLEEVLIIASALSVQDPRIRPMGQESAADDRHRQFADPRSDFMGLLKIWAFFEEARLHKKSNRKLVEQCHAHFLSYLRLREWHDLHGQLAGLVAEMGMRPNTTPATFEQIHRALLAGLIGNVGVKTEEGHYQGARDIKFHIHPASVLHRKGAKWVMAAELTETGKLYARSVAKIEPEWVEEVGAHLVKHHYFDPHWEKRGAQVMAFERTTLYGLTLTPRRRVHYGRIDPKTAREIFIRAALVAGEYDTQAHFFLHNQKLLEEIRELEHKSRRQDVLVDEERMFAFYDTRIPQDIVNGQGFEKWRREAERDKPRLLYMTREDLMRHGAEDVTEELFPASLKVKGVPCALSYRFEPGHPLDGVTLTVPLALLNRVDEARCEWLVPGMIREKLTTLIKGLPKRLRAACVPVPEFVTAFLDATVAPWAEQGSPPALINALNAFIQKRTGLTATRADWHPEALPAHLRMNFRVIDEAGAELACGRDLAELKHKLGQAAQLTFALSTASQHERVGLTEWNFGDLPERIQFTRGGQSLVGYPALLDEGASVALRLLDTPEAAARETRKGVRRLLWLALREQMKQWEKNLPGFTQIALQARSVMTPDELRVDLTTALADRAFIGDDPLPRNEKEFARQRDRAKTRLPAVAQGLARLAGEIFAEYAALNQRLAGRLPAPLVQDVRLQLAHLVRRHMFTETPWEQLAHFPRYLRAIGQRIDKYPGHAERDARHAADLKTWWQRYQERLEAQRKTGRIDPRLMAFRWMLEEMRVSLWAQGLKTPYPVSWKRLEKAWHDMA
ncbi:ATP-dependent RNA helicase HrpA [Thiobacter sp. AK1]|uniref:ATP-dependent RNA helicase HrpA n=1 Tax=Thiobacter aerophilum TaxID=3121275 RepID=A0ABV0EFH3_9BURK